MTTDDGLGELPMEIEKETDEGSSLLEGAGVFRFAVGVETTFIADADGTAVEGAAMSAYFVKAAMLGGGAILADVEVITDVDEATLQVIVLELLGGVVL